MKKILILFTMCPTTPHANPSQGNPMGKCTKNQVITSVGRFSNAEPVLNPVSSRFSYWEPIDTLKCENRTKNRHQVLTWPRNEYENRWIYIYEEPSRFSHKTQFRFAEFSVSFIGSSCSPANLLLLLLLFSLLLFLYSHCSCSFPVVVTFLTWCCSFSVTK